MRGGRRGGRSSSQASEVCHPNSCRIPLGRSIGMRIIRRLNGDSSTSNPPPDVQQHSSPTIVSIDEETFYFNAAASEVNAVSVSTGSPSSASIYIDNNDMPIPLSHQPPSNQYHEVLHVSSNGSFTNFSVTAYAQKLQDDMEEDPEEEVESALDPSFVYVNEHKVKVEHAPLIRAIFEAHGDITTETVVKSSTILCWLLEHICVIYNKLKEAKFFDVTLIELEQMLGEVRDIEGMKLNVGWLREKIESLIMTRVDFGKYLTIKEEERKSETKMEAIQRQISLLQAEWDAEKAKSEETKKFASDIRNRVVDHTTHSLVHGLFD